ncbi:UNVERIFIED_CONTAM: GrpB-like predicted nucleotidyltransferase (UPF0157 family) [Acetivibrio alkalicellulosi]
MTKPLDEMTNEERWKLFPIIICNHSPVWKEKYLLEKAIIEKVIGFDNISRINHIGSTTVPNLVAKPTIDILVEINDATDTEKLIINMKEAGYIYSPQPDNPAPHMMFMKGYTNEGFKGQVYHVHVRYSGDWDELYFKDYLLLHPEVAEEYGKLKIELKQKFEYNRDGYTYAKTDFIKNITKLARIEMENKYDV